MLLIRHFLRLVVRTVTTFLVDGCLRHLVVDFQAFDSLASLIPPPLVDLRLRHASPLGDLDDLLPRPEEITSPQLILQN